MNIINRFFVLFLLLSAQELASQTWSQQESNTDSTLINVYFVNNDIGYVCGVNGIVLKTVNGGSAWVTQNTGITDGLAVIQFINENTGYASGGFAGGDKMNCRLIKTTDGGASWNNVNVAATKCGGGSWFVSADTGFYAYADYLYGNSVIAKTNDGGGNWSVVYTGTGWISYFYFTDSKNGFATVNNGTVLKTTDGGQNWTITNLGVETWGSGIYFFNKDNGIVGGKTNGTAAMFKTGNGGESWQPIISDNMIFKIFFADNNNGYALSVDNTGIGKMIKSIDGGNTWEDEQLTSDNLSGIYFLNTNLGFAVGEAGTILKYSSAASGVEMPFRANNHITLYPNPFSNYATIRISDNISSEYLSIKICNVLGSQLEVKTHIHKSEIIIERGSLPVGFYFYKLKNELGVLGTGSFIIK